MVLTITDLQGEYPAYTSPQLKLKVESSIEAELIRLVGPPPEVQISAHPPHSPSCLIMCTADGPDMGRYFQTCKDPTASPTCSVPIAVTPPLNTQSENLQQLQDIRRQLQVQVPLPTKATILLWDEDFDDPWTFLVTPNPAGRVILRDNVTLLARANLVEGQDYELYQAGAWVEVDWNTPIPALPGNMLLMRIAHVEFLDGFDTHCRFI
ncbi:uncharacterized protein ARMOST_19435 [Armillaria ostoyae]|uniref:Uncharacterized protein n=1 Tax=Armillaria ostoyae TaxID=47428 RepID=A0A284S4L3_ARMOS|nr:uncharacterized protein ARMOST_19435 [Armillaria ostoyae]